MPKLREEATADTPQIDARYGIYKTEQYPHEVLCGSCSRTLYVDNVTFESFARAVELDPDNQFVCDDCLNEYEDTSHAAA
jgi:uncharacterized protein YlaI